MSSADGLVLLGFDVGKRRTGVAVGQTITGTASSLYTLACQNGLPDWQIVEKLIHQWQPDALVVGVPHSARASDHAIHELIRRFCHCLRDRFPLNVYTHDESYTSVEAYRRLKSLRQGGRPRKIRKEEIDGLAAAILLESWMAQSAAALDGERR